MKTLLKFLYPSKVIYTFLGLLPHFINTYLLYTGYFSEPGLIWAGSSIVMMLIGRSLIEDADEDRHKYFLFTLIVSYLVIPILIIEFISETFDFNDIKELDKKWIEYFDSIEKVKDKDRELIELGEQLRKKDQLL